MVYSCKVEQGVLLKVLAHAAKHPASSINGVLLGKATADGVTVTDVVPLCHTSITLAPAIEIGLAQAEAHAAQRGVQLVGYYQSDARFAPGELTAVGRKVADRVAEKQPSGAVLIMDNKKFEQFNKSQLDSPFDLFSKDGARGWKREGADAIHLSAGGDWKGLREEFFLMFKQQRHRELVDFEEHLDDCRKDYTNKAFATSSKFALPGNAL